MTDFRPNLANIADVDPAVIGDAVQEVLYEDVLDLHKESVRRIGEFRHYSFGKHDPDSLAYHEEHNYDDRRGDCYTLVIANMLHGLGVVLDGQLAIASIHQSTWQWHGRTTTGGEDTIPLRTMIRSSFDILSDPQGKIPGGVFDTLGATAISGINMSHFGKDGKPFISEEVLHVLEHGTNRTIQALALDRRDDSNFHNLTILRPDSRLTDTVLERLYIVA